MTGCVQCVLCTGSLKDGKCAVISHVVVELSERIRQFSRRHVIIEPLWRPVRGWCRNVPVEDGNNNTEHYSLGLGLKCCIFLFSLLLFIWSFVWLRNADYTLAVRIGSHFRGPRMVEKCFASSGSKIRIWERNTLTERELNTCSHCKLSQSFQTEWKLKHWVNMHINESRTTYMTI